MKQSKANRIILVGLFSIIFFMDSRAQKSINVGNQIWMTENLNVAKFRNGDPIPEAKTNEEWESAGSNRQPAWCYYNNDPINGKKYGRLYNWYAVKDPRGLAPKGWHIPTDKEWSTLVEFLGGENYAGIKMKCNEGWIKKGNGINTSKLKVLPGGGRDVDGEFYSLGEDANFWSTTLKDKAEAWSLFIYHFDDGVERDAASYEEGASVRCIKD